MAGKLRAAEIRLARRVCDPRADRETVTVVSAYMKGYMTPSVTAQVVTISAITFVVTHQSAYDLPVF